MTEQIYGFLAEQDETNQKVFLHFLRHPEKEIIFDDITVKFHTYVKNLRDFLQECIDQDLLVKEEARCFLSDKYKLSPRLKNEVRDSLKTKLEELFLV